MKHLYEYINEIMDIAEVNAQTDPRGSGPHSGVI